MKKNKEKVAVMKLSLYDWRLLIASMNEIRLNMKSRGEDTSVISDIILKVIDAPACR